MQADTHQFASRAPRTSSTFISNAVDGNSGANWAICPGTTNPRRRAWCAPRNMKGTHWSGWFLTLMGSNPFQRCC